MWMIPGHLTHLEVLQKREKEARALKREKLLTESELKISLIITFVNALTKCLRDTA